MYKAGSPDPQAVVRRTAGRMADDVPRALPHLRD
jgi:hypothetical protein